MSPDSNLTLDPAQAPVEFQYQSARHQADTAIGGMWLFLASEVLFFGALFLVFLTTFYQHRAGFAAATAQTELGIGTANTVLLVTSSFAYASAALFAQTDRRGGFRFGLLATALLGVAFLALKGVEWYLDIRAGAVPGARFVAHGADPGGQQLFWVFYYFATILHAIHMLVGLGLLARLGWITRRTPLPRLRSTVEVVGLYWSFVDMVWLMLYPAIYLVARGA